MNIPPMASLQKFLFAGICFLLAAVTLLSPIWPGSAIAEYVGGWLVWVSLVEILHGFRRSFEAERKSAWQSGAFSLLIAILLINAELLRANALTMFVVGVFILDAFRYFYKYYRGSKSLTGRWQDLAAGIGNLVLIAVFFIFSQKGVGWLLSIVIALRMVGIGFSILAAKTGILEEVNIDVVRDIGLENNPLMIDLAEKIEKEEEAQAPYEKRWIVVFLLILFFIHLGRMGYDRSFIKVLSPLVATIGDAVIALVIAYLIIGPLRTSVKRSTGWIDHNLWLWVEKEPREKRKWWSLRNPVGFWLQHRLRNTIRFRKAAYSVRTAIRTGLGIGLPYSALLAAIMPVLGMSWYFDTENWASGMWDRWAATRADQWRMAMTKSTGEGFGPDAFKLHPPGLNGTGDFSFVVIGDPGEGDASQLVLKDQLLSVSNQPEVKFVVISSDVVYPSGALKDYERKFWMPFKGLNKPVYAIPGNHDWYDALEGFVATFYEPQAAQTAMEARLRKDLYLSSTTSNKIKKMVATAARWRDEYRIPTGYQKAPYFQVTNGNFVLITVETGVERQIDTLQMTWLTNVLEASKGKFVMVLLGHPFYAIGQYQGIMNPAFQRLHKLLRDYKVPLVMAGDTHDLEYYIEPPANGDGHTMHHFVNGGGGAYLSIGTAMAKPATMPTKEYSFYPSRNPLTKKIEENTSWYKYPAWWWTKSLDGWPFSAEWLSAMFDYNVSPFFQSFLEIKVESSQNRVRLIPYNNNGRLTWKDITSTAGAKPQGAKENDPAEWIIQMKN